MAIVSPSVMVAERAQDLTCTVTLSPAESVVGWTVDAVLRSYQGGPALVTKTTGSGVVVTNSATGVFTITFSAADLTQPPGGYVWEFRRTNAGATYPIVEPSAFIIRGDAAGAYPTLTNLSEYLAAVGLTTVSDTEATKWLQFLFAAESYLRRVCGRQFTYGTYTEYPLADWTDAIKLRETPVESITSLYLDRDRVFGSDTLLTAGTDYLLEVDKPDGLAHAGFVRRLNSFWQGDRQRPIGLLSFKQVPAVGILKVVYVAGYKLVPYDLKAAVWELTTFHRQRSGAPGIPTSQSGEGHSVSFLPPDALAKLPGSVESVIGLYRRGDLFVG